MICSRIIVLILVIAATACAACANVFALFYGDNLGIKTIQTLWYSKTRAGGADTVSKVADSPCKEYKTFFTVSEGVAVGAAGLGFIVFLLAIAQLAMRSRVCCLRDFISRLLLLAFCAAGVCVALSVYGYLKGYCQDDALLAPIYGSFQERKFNFSLAFYLICASCGLFLIADIFECCA
ncbi:Amastin surface glycoprotein [Trypanosoma melophagium]|uniref:Amastin surface glycoprotein n=1 Tax=Trypanosoma melophagium TaxID=715481 RepID=UPI00351A7C2C|nr:Amastin surface glycoprotein [Trypanosoma melophagium]KAH9577188.1 Amastin surface glycoprotein [Trypanosoma melophagium]